MIGRFLFWLLLAWPTPALIAGALGWKGIWGSGSATVDYLIPIPVAGGVFHAMSFIAISALLVSAPRWPGILRGIAHAVLFGISLAGALLIFDPERREWTAEPFGDLTRRRIVEHRPVFEEQRRKLVRLDAGCLEQAARLLIPRDVDPPVRNEIAGEEVLDRV